MKEVLVTGTFNIVHPGHVRLLEFASKYGRVTVGLNADPYLKRKYGDAALPLIDRSYVLQSIRYVDEVVVFREDEPSALILKLKPEYYIKGPDYTLDTLPELPAIESVGAHLIIQPDRKEYSSTEIISKAEDIQHHVSAFKKLNKFT